MALQANHWWDLNPRWSIGAGLGVQLNYFHLRSFKSMETVSSLTNVELSAGEDTLWLRRTEQAVTSAIGNVWGEYSISRGKSHDFRLTGGVLVQRPIVTNMNTVYQARVSPLTYLLSIGTAGSVQSTTSESEINNYFRSQVPDWQANLRMGIIFYFFSVRNPNDQFYINFEYDHGLNPMMQGLSGPVRALRMGMGMRFLR
jgi:hypothetical protein